MAAAILPKHTTMKNKKILSIVAGGIAMMAFAAASPAFADTGVNIGVKTDLRMDKRDDDNQGPGNAMMKPALVGKVTSVSSTTLVVSGSQGFMKDSTTTSFTVNAANATIRKGNSTSTLSSIAVGDTVMVRGTVTGTSIVATSIEAGMKSKGGEDKDHASSTPPFTGNGQPVVAGTISAITGTSITVTTKSNVSYAVDASSAKVLQGKAASTVSALKVGDEVIVQGTVNGTSITAASVISGKANANGNANGNGKGRGFFASIGHFFASLFGF